MPVVMDKKETVEIQERDTDLREPSVQYDSGYLNLKEALQFLHIEKPALEKLVRNKRIVAYKIGGAYLRFKRNELILLKHEMTRAKKSRFSGNELSRFMEANGFYIGSVTLLSAVYVYLVLA